MAETPSLYDWAGGAKAFDRLADAFFRRVGVDGALARLFEHLPADHPRRVALWLAEVFGGPAGYSKAYDGGLLLLGEPVGTVITEPQRRRWMTLMQDAADSAGLPDDPAFRASYVGYLEWASRVVKRKPAPVTDLPVPHWEWSVTPPFPG